MARRAWAEYAPPSPKPPPELVPIFGPQLGWSPDRECREIHGPFKAGSRLCCMACHTSGVERLVSRHTKPGDGQTREGWATPTPTRPELPLDRRGPGGRSAQPAGKGKPPLKGGHR